jgi:hypothetical protein
MDPDPDSQYGPGSTKSLNPDPDTVPVYLFIKYFGSHLNSVSKFWSHIRYLVSPDIRYPAFTLYQYPAKSESCVYRTVPNWYLFYLKLFCLYRIYNI